MVQEAGAEGITRDALKDESTYRPDALKRAITRHKVIGVITEEDDTPRAATD
ncbi:MAG: hypothetical protein KDK53_16310 [Maritimibacter sp.]|nr:hypothetical protein [Sedimentitalea sp.]MCB1357979.1 hypothetical protein [Maritimibacter sp.]